MRTTRFFLTLALLVSPAIASAQVGTCNATTPAGVNPTCSLTRSATSTVANILKLTILDTAAIDLLANDTLAYQKTRTAAGNSSGAVTTPADLQVAASFDSVIVLANRGFTLTLKAVSLVFDFERDANYNVCRSTGSAVSFPASTCTGTELLGGKPIGDLYWKTSTGTLTAMSTAPTAGNVRSNSTGERFTAKIYYSSAWFYATDIPGQYSARLLYTLTGQ